ncbi:MAG: glutamate-5-semialdehyde dehydrogenase [Oscillospiraceae bacterium]|nr:glutamate-5-semialdehyde dehydrogenase [Oscillospiraceae bacterium]
MTVLEQQGAAAKAASRSLAIAGTGTKNQALCAIADALEQRTAEILSANARDLAAARDAGMRESLLDRLLLNPARISAIAAGVRAVAALPDPIGVTSGMRVLPNGLTVGKKTVPLGVVGIIYEARPNVTVDAAVLCLKAGNAVILRGGKEAYHSSQAMTEIMRAAIAGAGLPADAVSLVQDATRASAQELMQLTDYLDVLIPRGGRALIASVVQNARVPVIETGWGNCHVYVEKTADLAMAARIIQNAKCSRPSVCNAAETLLVDEAVAADFLPMAKRALDEYHCRLRGCEKTRAILGDCVTPATAADWDTEYGDYILAVKVVSGMDEAISHIMTHTSGHSECIVTSNYFAETRFMNEVDAAAVYCNASTRFTDGGEFGLGAEIGISTQKMHARGPMGLEALTSTKFLVYGTGQVR